MDFSSKQAKAASYLLELRTDDSWHWRQINALSDELPLISLWFSQNNNIAQQKFFNKVGLSHFYGGGSANWPLAILSPVFALCQAAQTHNQCFVCNWEAQRSISNSHHSSDGISHLTWAKYREQDVINNIVLDGGN